jgi:hypothetical protein
MAAEIDFKYKWLYGGYTATVTFTKLMVSKEEIIPFIPGVTKSLVGSYTKKYSGTTTFDIINAIKKDISDATMAQARQNVVSATKAVATAQTASRKVNESAAAEAVRQTNKAALAYMLTNFCGYKKTVTATSGLKGSLQAQTKRVGYVGSKKVITPGRENACDALDAAYRNKSQVYPDSQSLVNKIENPTVAGEVIDNKQAYTDIYTKGESAKWVIPSTGGTRRSRKNAK